MSAAVLDQPFVERFREPDTPYLSPTRVADFFGFRVQELAERARVHRNTPTARPQAPQLQKYLQDMVRVLAVATEMTGDADRAASVDDADLVGREASGSDGLSAVEAEEIGDEGDDPVALGAAAMIALTGDTLHEAYRKRLFDPLGLKRTYLEYATKPATAPYEGNAADFYIGDFPGRTGRFNISFDWAGGGVVSTAEDLNRFIRALGEGRLFGKAETLALMTSPQWRETRGDLVVERGLGVSRLTAPDGVSYFGHTGFWGAIMLYEPGTGISLGGTLNQVGHNPAPWAIDLLRAARPREAATN